MVNVITAMRILREVCDDASAEMNSCIRAVTTMMKEVVDKSGIEDRTKPVVNDIIRKQAIDTIMNEKEKILAVLSVIDLVTAKRND